MDERARNVFAVSTKTGTLGATQPFGEQVYSIRVSSPKKKKRVMLRRNLFTLEILYLVST
jgi:hypothetical protein